MTVLIGFVLSGVDVLEATEGHTYKVKGIVVAVTVNQTPPLIVVNTPISPKNHMTVGATVTSQTKIVRGEKRITLHAIKVGDTVWLTYMKTTNGLYARTIKVK
ncbi:hypothetical protein [Nitrospira sp. KM1]|uniref:hypothetical protein n=1 Tax=Nitrospira sp. KM1 TaxID=1936990 RepID=UPI001563D7C7|nr:hypothetical protein [Nitrospira sp. KM1]